MAPKAASGMRRRNRGAHGHRCNLCMASAEGLPDRRTLERALRQAGLSARLAKRLLAAGWPALVGEQQAEVDELRTRLSDLTAELRGHDDAQ